MINFMRRLSGVAISLRETKSKERPSPAHCVGTLSPKSPGRGSRKFNHCEKSPQCSLSALNTLCAPKSTRRGSRKFNHCEKSQQCSLSALNTLCAPKSTGRGSRKFNHCEKSPQCTLSPRSSGRGWRAAPGEGAVALNACKSSAIVFNTNAVLMNTSSFQNRKTR